MGEPTIGDVIRSIQRGDLSISTESISTDKSLVEVELDDRMVEVHNKNLKAKEDASKCKPLKKRGSTESASHEKVKSSSHKIKMTTKELREMKGKSLTLHDHFITFGGKASHLKDEVSVLVSKYNSCKSDDEKVEFKQSHQEEIARLKTRLNEYKMNLDEMAKKIPGEDDKITAKTIDARFKSITESKGKISEEQKFQHFNLYGSISTAYKNCMRAITDLSKLETDLSKLEKDKELLLNFDDVENCQKFTPFVKALQDETRRIETETRELRVQHEFFLKRQMNNPNEQELVKNNKDERVPLKNVADELAKNIEKSLVKLNEISSRISMNGNQVKIKEMMEMLEKKATPQGSPLEKSQTEILSSTKATINSLSASKEVLKHIENEQYNELVKETIKSDSKLNQKTKELFENNETNESILQNNDLKNLSIERANASNKQQEYTTRVQAKFNEELEGIKSKNDPLEAVQQHAMYNKTDDESIQRHLKRELRTVLETKIHKLSEDEKKNKAEIEGLRGRIKDLNI